MHYAMVNMMIKQTSEFIKNVSSSKSHNKTPSLLDFKKKFLAHSFKNRFQ